MNWDGVLLERRTARRFRVTWPVIVKGCDSEGLGFEEVGALGNLSSSGAYLYLARYFPVGTNLDVLIKVPLRRENWIRYSAEVVRAEEGSYAEGFPEVGLAMRFNVSRPAFA